MERLNKPVDVINIVLFRILFGSIMLFEMISYWNIPFIDELIIKPKIHFTFDFASWVQPGPLPLMKALLVLNMVAAVFIIIGRFFKPAIFTFTLIYIYFFLLDKTYYNNHIYFIGNICIVFCLTQAHLNPFGKKDAKGKSSVQTVPYWQLFLFQFLFFIVYFYGGLAKLNADWITGKVTEKWLNGFPDVSVLQTNEASLFFANAGLIFDLLIGFLLFYPKTRKLAFILCFIFNVNNAIMFKDISIFPYLMIGSLVLFIEPIYIRTKWDAVVKLATKLSEKPMEVKANPFPKWLLFFLIFHLLFPFRQVLFAGHTDWTGKAQFFSWRMKSQHRKSNNITFYLTHDNHPEKIRVPVEEYLAYEQFYAMAYHPEMLVQFAQFLKKDLSKKGVPNPVITAVTDVSLNGRPFQSMVDSTMDLTKIQLGVFKQYDWVLPLKDR